ncbi:TonB-dependent receptor [Silvibacterium dinghuense]|uniref:TonB-dependent receptor n=1 Tax=Silvibacterium dinghuense TaxID=1560006 RepID=A0A4Q1SAW3_9BACT|nr:carboxypeptidase regulatory-like domain-containing protein [Silvibacterium dinghuense]RXS94288.1 TonB-dependent receptor [Silvibacterium dinghuense]
MVAVALWLFTSTHSCFAQTDQGAITGIALDPSGAVIPGASVSVTNVETGLVLQAATNGNGVFVFSPLKIGHYTITVSSKGFKTVTRENLQLDIQQRLSVNFTLPLGSTAETVNVSSSAPVLQTQDAAVGQVISTKEINDTPLNGRNWVYIAQLTNGVAPPFGNTRGSGSGDFVANGQRAEQNDFILDGVDNNTNLVDFLNGSSYIMRPPPDALSEFSLQTSNFSAEFGHSAGAVLQANIKSGTNQIHGDVWEYFRNTNLDAINWNAGPDAQIPPYHQNQFGGTLGFPIWRNKLFYFGDIEANRISISNPTPINVPSALERQGDFSELLNGNLTGVGASTYLYQPNSADPNQPLTCNGQTNVFCANQINAVAQRILNLYPSPNANNGKLYNNYLVNLGNTDNIAQWDQRLDWNISSKDQIYARYSYLHEIKTNGLPLGPVLDGSGYGGQYDTNLAMNFSGSETHIFTPTLTNEFRFGYNWGVFNFQQPNAYNPTLATSLGLGAQPSYLKPGQYGLPYGYVNGAIQQWGSVGISRESQNVYQILDNVTKIWGNHSLKFGASFQAVRFYYIYAPVDRGQYQWNGQYTGLVGVANTGSAVADMLADQEDYAAISVSPNVNDAQWYDAGYVQDDWRLTHKLTLNLGVRYDYFQPYKEMAGQQSNFIVTGPLGIGTGSGVLQFPKSQQNVALGAPFLNALAKDNVTIQYVDNDRLVTSQKTDFAPRIGFAYSPRETTVIRSGFGIFYGGLQSLGNGNLGANFPYSNQASFYAPTCVQDDCPSLASQGISLQAGLLPATNNGQLQTFISQPGFHSMDAKVKPPYTMTYSLGVQQQLSPNFTFTTTYVGNLSRHMELYAAPNTAPRLWRPGTNTNPFNPFPDLGGIGQVSFAGVSTYNSLQAKLEKRYSHGLSFLATYTWSHALDDASDAGGLFSAIGVRQPALIPYIDELTNSVFDIRNRFTLNGNYELPFGHGRAFLSNSSRWLDELAGGWSSSLTYAAQTGVPFTVSPNISTASGGSARAYPVHDPYAGGGTPDPSNPSLTSCPATVKTKLNYINPCAFRNPLPGETISDATHPVGSVNSDGVPVLFAGPVTDRATALALLGGRQNTVYGPGYYQVNMSLFKNFTTWRAQFLQFRADAFNVLNHPTLGTPNGSMNATGGLISGPKFFQNNTPDARFFQLSLKYVF